ncbi:MAG TPA: CopG family transcriptional regulator [Sphingomonas sp.]|nr:CopG family transcriptional regulator [Sphingomonas sp.]
MQTSKIRHQFYLPDELSRALDALASKPGSSKSAILTDALRAWMERKAAHEIDARFGPRLDRQQRIAERSETMLGAIAEMLDLFVAHQLTLTAHQPPFDRETGQLGRQRYQQFIDQVARRLASNPGVPRLLAAAKAKEEQP